MTFKQPPDKPSTVTYFISFLKLGEVLGYVLRTIVRSPPKLSLSIEISSLA